MNYCVTIIIFISFVSYIFATEPAVSIDDELKKISRSMSQVLESKDPISKQVMELACKELERQAQQLVQNINLKIENNIEDAAKLQEILNTLESERGIILFYGVETGRLREQTMWKKFNVLLKEGYVSLVQKTRDETIQCLKEYAEKRLKYLQKSKDLPASLTLQEYLDIFFKEAQKSKSNKYYLQIKPGKREELQTQLDNLRKKRETRALELIQKEGKLAVDAMNYANLLIKEESLADYQKGSILEKMNEFYVRYADAEEIAVERSKLNKDQSDKIRSICSSITNAGYNDPQYSALISEIGVYESLLIGSNPKYYARIHQDMMDALAYKNNLLTPPVLHTQLKEAMNIEKKLSDCTPIKKCN